MLSVFLSLNISLYSQTATIIIDFFIDRAIVVVTNYDTDTLCVIVCVIEMSLVNKQYRTFTITHWKSNITNTTNLDEKWKSPHISKEISILPLQIPLTIIIAM